MRSSSTAQGDSDHWKETSFRLGDSYESLHEAIKDTLIGVMIAVADTHAAGMSPDSRRQKQELQPGTFRWSTSPGRSRPRSQWAIRSCSSLPNLRR